MKAIQAPIGKPLKTREFAHQWVFCASRIREFRERLNWISGSRDDNLGFRSAQLGDSSEAKFELWA
jgi:hypothetical protein